MIRIIHSADNHYSKAAQEPALKSLMHLYEYGKNNRTDLWVFAGDLFDRAIYNTASSGLPELLALVQKMLKVAPIVVITGTPTHDISGCYDVFTRISGAHNFTVVRPGEPYFLDKRVSQVSGENNRLLILGCPEPGKEWLLSDKKGLNLGESNDQILDAMKQLFFGMGALRRQYADLPCLFMYHGSVVGASFQNGRMIEAGSDLAIGKDDLAMIGADYYALGHIHKYQQVGNLPAYYPGSAYPVDWGETDQKGFNRVEIAGDKKVNVTKVDFPHPPRKKLTARGSSKNITSGEVTGYKVWLEISGSALELKQIDFEVELKRLMDMGAHSGSRVTGVPVSSETIRAGKIQKADTLREKVKIHGENASLKVTEGLLMKADELEAIGKAEGVFTDGHHLRLSRLRLRGAIGIWKGLKKEEVEIDLDQYDRGLIALIGKNGGGKTTLIENMHPYPCYLTRSKKLQDQFYLKDSYRDLYFIDEKSRSEYRALILIDGKSKTGKSEYYLYRKSGGVFTPMTNGRKEDYQNAVNRIFGSLTLFLNTAFISQKTTKLNPELDAATAGQRKSILRELAGLDYLQSYSEMARERAKELEKELLHSKGTLEGLNRSLEEMPGLEEQLQTTRREYDGKKALLDKLEQEGKTLAEEVRGLAGRRETNRQVTSRLLVLREGYKKLMEEQTGLKGDIRELEKIERRSDTIRNELFEYNNLKKQEERFLENKSRVQEQCLKMKEHYLTQKELADQGLREIEKQIQGFHFQIANLRGEKNNFSYQYKQLKAKLNEKLECPECGNRFCLEEKSLSEEFRAIEYRLAETDRNLSLLNNRIKELEVKKQEVRRPDKPVFPVFDESPILEIRESLDFIDIQTLREESRQAEAAGIRIGEFKKRLKQVNTDLVVIMAETKELEEQLDDSVEEQYRVKEEGLNRFRLEYRECRDRVRVLETELEYLTKRLGEIKVLEQELKKLRKNIRENETGREDWFSLEKACGPDGIQALELDALSPGIAYHANRLLEAAYGSRFQIEFRTTRIGGRGSKTKQIEDFLIIVHDLENGTEQEMSTLSGGEVVWIKRAINDAFSIIRANNTGLKFLTAFQDEADGALDPESKEAYFRMLKAAHQESGRAHTIVITHSPEAQVSIRQKIYITELKESAAHESAA